MSVHVPVFTGQQTHPIHATQSSQQVRASVREENNNHSITVFITHADHLSELFKMYTFHMQSLSCQE